MPNDRLSTSPTAPRPRRRVPTITWLGIVGTAFLALAGLASTGVWGMLVMVALVVLSTMLYGVAFRRSTWLRIPRKRASAAIGAGIALVALIGSTSAYGATHAMPQSPAHLAAATAPSATAHAKPKASPRPTPTAIATPTPTPVVTTETVTETSRIPFGATTVESATLAQGTTTVTTPGVRGVDTKTYVVTYTDGVETDRVLQSDQVTTPPVNQVTTVGTYVAPVAPAAPTCTNGSYVNSAGATVCRPEAASSAPAGATAKCGDGTYSFSQSRRGTCSSHGGVAVWL
ncbi:DUF3761 domain-containing protein [Curtobacterium sp. A7_M15]|uniref:DUF3761 domain-containing protein n=1 Tax=Curtobacterium sp. A7_M15 TaxID=3065241 RepID=UPI002737D625|nr:DUF3761 domain-containing protein [Curtobacterium sp. A7_M15]MDP4333287.1 DUF3761 domain-containing protein [Curtobacterium sp. A7_M15]